MKKFLIILSVVAFFFIGTHSANSMCVYNDTEFGDRTFKVLFGCGFLCGNVWGLAPRIPHDPRPPDSYACRPSKGGTVSVCSSACRPSILTPHTCPKQCTIARCKVEPHGWVVISQPHPETSEITCTPFK